MSQNTPYRRKLASLKKTGRAGDFANMRLWWPDRVVIVAEGDSWFAYPKQWIVAGDKKRPTNLVDHISGWTRGKANFYSMASNGDEAVDMLSGQQKHDLVKVLRWHEGGKNRKPVDLLLFSGGGNDVVGDNDIERFLNVHQPGYSAEQCVNLPRLQRKCRQIALAYEELADIRDHYSPNTVVLTHTYDYPPPSDRGASVLGGLVYIKPWIKRFMDKNGIPDELQTGVVATIMDTMAEMTLKVGKARKNFAVVDTRGTLSTRAQWLNEIHPDSEGFKLIADKIYGVMTGYFPKLK